MCSGLKLNVLFLKGGQRRLPHLPHPISTTGLIASSFHFSMHSLWISEFSCSNMHGFKYQKLLKPFVTNKALPVKWNNLQQKQCNPDSFSDNKHLLKISVNVFKYFIEPLFGNTSSLKLSAISNFNYSVAGNRWAFLVLILFWSCFD